MSSQIVTAALVLYGLALALIGVWAGRRVRSAGEFFVAGRRLGPGMLAATVLAANIGSGTTVGVAGFAYDVGVAAWWWTGAIVAGTIVLGLTLGPRLWQIAHDLDCYTVGDYLEWRFSRELRIAVMAILWLGSISILMAQITAIGFVVQAVGDVRLSFGIVLGGVVVAIYYTAGGLWSSAVVNVVQLAVKLVAFPLALLAAARISGGFAAFRNATATAGESFLSPWSIGLPGIIGYVVVLGASFVISPGLLQKGFGARDAAAARRGFLLSAAGLAAFAFIPVTLGMLARVHWPEPIQAGEPNWVLPALLVEVLPPLLGTLTLAAVVSAELSSADAVLFMLSTSMSRDFYQTYWNPEARDADLLRAGRIAGIVGLLAAIGMGLLLPSILAGLNVFYGLMVIALAVPLFAGVYSPRTGNAAALASLGASLPVALVTLALTGGPSRTNFWPYALGILVGATACLLVTRLRPAPASR